MSLKFTFGNNFTVEVPDHEMKRQLRGLGPDGSDKVDADHTELSIFSQTDVADAASLGRAVLSQVCFVCFSLLPSPGTRAVSNIY